MIDDDYLFKRFPEMQPISYVPSLQYNIIWGIGHWVIGERDRDPATGIFVTTIWLFLFHIPIIAFGSYRVAEMPVQQGALELLPRREFRFFGRVPMWKPFRIWNCLVFAAFVSGLVFIWWKLSK